MKVHMQSLGANDDQMSACACVNLTETRCTDTLCIYHVMNMLISYFTLLDAIKFE